MQTLVHFVLGSLYLHKKFHGTNQLPTGVRYLYHTSKPFDTNLLQQLSRTGTLLFWVRTDTGKRIQLVFSDSRFEITTSTYAVVLSSPITMQSA